MTKDSNNRIVMDIFGDICLSWSKQKEQDLINIANHMNRTFGIVDYRIANLEAPLLEKEGIMPSPKESPSANLCMYENHIPFFKVLNIDAYTLANNHIGDFGAKGIESTINFLNKFEKKYVGTSLNMEDTYKSLRLEIKGTKFSIFSFCENEFGVVNDEKIGVAGFRTDIIKELIRSEKYWADKVIVIFHGGTEHYPFPTPNQKERYRWMADIGADVIIGMHSHCPVGFEQYSGKWIFYGIGNFYFPRETCCLYENWYFGYAVRLIFSRNGEIKIRTIPYTFDDTGTFTLLEEGIAYLKKLSNSIKDDYKIRRLFQGWIYYNGKNIYEILKDNIKKEQDPFSFNIVKNLLTCEAHTELLKGYVNMKYYEKTKEYIKELDYIKDYINCRSSFGMKKQQKQEENKTVILWGFTDKTVENLHRLKVNMDFQIFIVDKDERKQGFEFEGYMVHNPEELILQYENAWFYIGTSYEAFKIIQRNLISKGIKKDKILYE